eukprot:jgi/Hompol1/2848/HPOL_006192-RA
MPATDSQAVLAWITSIEEVSSLPTSLQDLADGNAFMEVLSTIDPNWFRLNKPTDANANWVLKFNTLKRMHKLIGSYFEEYLSQSITGLNFDNAKLQLLAQGDAEQILRFAHLIIALAVQSANNQRYIEKIQSLSQSDQHELMLAIEEVMAMVSQTEEETNMNEEMIQQAAAKNQLEYEGANLVLRKQLEAMKQQNDKLVAEKEEALSQIADLDRTLSEFKSAGNVDFLLRSEIDKLKIELDKSESQRHEFEALAEAQAAKLSESTKKIEQYSRQEEELQRLRDQLDEFRHAADRLQKSEAMVDKYKKKIDESVELRRTVKVLEEQLLASETRSAALEEEYRK